MAETKILVVDDDHTIADSVEALLRAKGYTVLRAVDGMEAIAVAQKEMPTLLILDLLMPKMSGFDVCGVLKGASATNKIAILVLTALGQMGDVEKAFSLGADDYLIKPFDSERLLRKVTKLLGPPA
jgi:DNA-binding response OmpR family regulator